MTPPPAAVDTEAAVALLARLVGFDTVSAHSNLALIHWCADYLRGLGIAPVVLPDPSGAKANLFATIGPMVPGGVVLSGHTDVVPADSAEWDSPPFALAERDGRLFGRGAADMKGFLAIALTLVPRLKTLRLTRPIHLAFSYDEEVGCFGAPALAAHIRRHLPAPALVIVGEPTSMQPANAHKGMHCFDTEVIGREGHASAPQDGASAIAYAAELARFIGKLAAERGATARDERFDPPYGTFNIGTIAGGTARNVIAGSCRLTWEYRSLPDDDVAGLIGRIDHCQAELAARLKAEAPGGGISTEQVVVVPALHPDPDGTAEALARQLSGANAARTVAFGTEAGIYQQAGLPTVVIGPGDIAMAHQPNEYITRAQLAEGGAFLSRLADWATS